MGNFLLGLAHVHWILYSPTLWIWFGLLTHMTAQGIMERLESVLSHDSWYYIYKANFTVCSSFCKSRSLLCCWRFVLTAMTVDSLHCTVWTEAILLHGHTNKAACHNSYRFCIDINRSLLGSLNHSSVWTNKLTLQLCTSAVTLTRSELRIVVFWPMDNTPGYSLKSICLRNQSDWTLICEATKLNVQWIDFLHCYEGGWVWPLNNDILSETAVWGNTSSRAGGMLHS